MGCDMSDKAVFICKDCFGEYHAIRNIPCPYQPQQKLLVNSLKRKFADAF